MFTSDTCQPREKNKWDKMELKPEGRVDVWRVLQLQLPGATRVTE